MLNKKFYILGLGNMASALIDAFIASGNLKSSNLVVLHSDLEKAKLLSKNFNCDFLSLSNLKLEKDSILLIGLKPQKFFEISNTIKDFILSDVLVLSIMAGVKSSVFKDIFNTDLLIRLMPNLGIKVNSGVTGLFANTNIPTESLTYVKSLLKLSGHTEVVLDEDLLDAITAVSGSGPAFFAKYLNASIVEAQNLGFSKESAINISIKTVLGTLLYLDKTKNLPNEFIEKVKSKKGTTEAGIESLDQDNFETIVGRAINKAFLRAKELS